jgi:uncharacterized protein YqgC (DUF456 family)
MTVSEIIGFLLTLLVMMVGLAGSALPALPGTPLIFVAALGHKLWFGPSAPHWIVIVGLGLLAGLSMLLDFLATTYGAKRLGATWKGMVGAGVGAVIGVFVFPPFGLILLPMIGAALAEMAGGREWRESGKAGIGAALGIIAGTLGKIGCSLAMIGLWVFSFLMRRI